jgi:putative membrane protein
MRALVVILAVGLFGALLLCSPAPVFAGPTGPADGVSDQDRYYANFAHQNNLFETTTGTMAETKGVCRRVRELGAEFAEHHLALDADLVAVAARNQIVLDAPPNPVFTAALADLAARSGPDFDRAWLRDQIAVHQQALAYGDKEIRYGRSSDVKGLAQASAPILAGHLAEAEAALADCGLA